MPAVLVVVEPQCLLARVALRRGMGLVAADPFEAAAVDSAESDLDAAVALAQDAGGRFPLGRVSTWSSSGRRRRCMMKTVSHVSSKMQLTRLRSLSVKRTDTSAGRAPSRAASTSSATTGTCCCIRQACLGTRRFDDFQAALGIGRNILTQRLARLVDEELLAKVQYQENPPRLRVPPHR